MSQTNIEDEVSVPDAYDGDIDKWATAAVRGANNWLVTLRNATDEGIRIWSDEFTDGRNGIMSYSEGMTSLSLVENHVDTDKQGRENWETLRPEHYEEDLKYILDQINSEGGPKLKSDPYIPKLDTHNFTPAATFSTSALLESIDADIIEDFEEIEEEELQDALRTNLDWLLSNKFEVEADGDKAAGWGWVGEEDEEYAEDAKPSNYYTYSATIVLCDLLRYRERNDILEEVVSESEEELIETLNQANTFLLQKHWYPEEGNWIIPLRMTDTVEQDVEDVEKMLSTCYAFIGLSYLEDTRDEIDMTSEQKERMGRGINWALNYYDKDPFLWTRFIKKKCGTGTFVDGSTPYVLLDSLVEVLNWRSDLLDYVDDWEEEEIERSVRNELAKSILYYCWAGDDKFEQKGFRHIGEGENLVKGKDISPDDPDNMTAIYSTGVAIETFLLNFLNEGGIIEDILQEEDQRDTESTSADIEKKTDVADTQSQMVEKTVNNNTFIVDGESDYPSELDDHLQTIRSEVKKLTDDVDSSDSIDDSAYGGFGEDDLEFVLKLNELASTLGHEYNNWTDDVVEELPTNVKQSFGSSFDQDWDELFKGANQEDFLEFIVRAYFCPDRETYEDVVRLENRHKFLLPPQREVHDKVDKWEEAEFADEYERKNRVKEMVEDLSEEPWGGEEKEDAVHQFQKKYKEEVMGNN